MFLEIDLNGVKREDLFNALSNLNVKYKEFSNPLKKAFEEEVIFRFESMIENADKSLKEKLESIDLSLEEKLIQSVADELTNSESIFDYDYMDSIIEKYIDIHVNKKIETKIFISEEKLKETKLKLSIDDLELIENSMFEGVEIGTDSTELIASTYFGDNLAKLSLYLCSGQTNYWLETHLVTNDLKLCKSETYVSEPFFELENGDELVSFDKNSFKYVAKLIV